MTKILNSVKCPSCGASISRESFLSNHECPNCHDDLSDDDSILNSFGMNETADDDEFFQSLLASSKYGSKNDSQNTIPTQPQSNSSSNIEDTIIEENHEFEEVKPDSVTDSLNMLQEALSNMTESNNHNEVNSFTEDIKSANCNNEIPDEIPSPCEESLSDASQDKSEVPFEDSSNIFISDNDISKESPSDLILNPSEEIPDNKSSLKNISSADAIREKLIKKNVQIDANSYAMASNENKEDVPEYFNSNHDHYYDDTPSLLPPEPDIIKVSTIRNALLYILVILFVSAYLIFVL